MNTELFDFISASPTAFQMVEHTAEMFENAGYTRLLESDRWEIKAGGKYYIIRNGSSIIAFRIPLSDAHGFMMSAAHSDNPSFKIKDNEEICGDSFVRLSTEKYGSPIYSTWLDRPLAIAGRLAVRSAHGIDIKNVNLEQPCAVIPNVAIHMNRSLNDNAGYNPAVDLVPVFSARKGGIKELVCASAGVNEKDVMASDLFLYNPQRGAEFNGMIVCPRLDDLQCAYSAVKAFLESEEGKSIPVCCVFDNEEVGSETKQGAASTFLYDVLSGICVGTGANLREMLANSFLMSCDNAHAIHPNHPELSDKNNSVKINGGIVIKYNANQKYTTDAVSSAVVKLLCEEAKVPYQVYSNRSDMPGGSTLGNISNTQVSVNAADIGLAQLAMHSSCETAGAEDTAYLVKMLRLFFSKSFIETKNGYSLI